MSNLPGAIGGLSVAEKFELIDALWEDLEAAVPLLTEAQRDELDLRVSRYEQDRSAAIPWEQVRANVLKKQ
jgi:putative addiction module component (TIGR02574 family)